MKSGKVWTPTPTGQEQFSPETLASSVMMDEESPGKSLPQKLEELATAIDMVQALLQEIITIVYR